MRKLKTLNVEKLKDKEVEETNPNLVEYSNLIKDVLENEGVSGTCEEEMLGLEPGTYYTDENKNDITTDVYLKH